MLLASSAAKGLVNVLRSLLLLLVLVLVTCAVVVAWLRALRRLALALEADEEARRPRRIMAEGRPGT